MNSANVAVVNESQKEQSNAVGKPLVNLANAKQQDPPQKINQPSFDYLKTPASVNGVGVEAILDTGANVVILSSTVARRADLKPEPCTMTIKIADGKYANVEGFVREVPITLAGTTRKIDCIIMKTRTYEVLLGTNALHAFGAVIDFKGKTIKINGRNITMNFEKAKPVTWMTAAEVRTLGLGQRISIKVKINKNCEPTRKNVLILQPNVTSKEMGGGGSRRDLFSYGNSEPNLQSRSG